MLVTLILKTRILLVVGYVELYCYPIRSLSGMQYATISGTVRILKTAHTELSYHIC